jgi:hypothetical protein
LSTALLITQGSVCYLDGLLKSIDLPKYIIELALHALEIRPDRPHKSKENRKEDDREHILVGLAN